MRKVQTGVIKPEYLSRASELEASSSLNSKIANSLYQQGTAMQPSDRRTDFIESARSHLQSAVGSSVERYQMSTVRIPKSNFTNKADQPKSEFN